MANRPVVGSSSGSAADDVGQAARPRWYVYFDRYREHRYGALASKDLKTWVDVTDRLVVPNGIRHGTAFAVPAADARRLLGGAP